MYLTHKETNIQRGKEDVLICLIEKLDKDYLCYS